MCSIFESDYVYNRQPDSKIEQLRIIINLIALRITVSLTDI